MRFEETELSGAYIIRLQANEDERGSFVRTFCRTEFEKRGLNSRVVQCNFSYNLKRGTLRGLHYQETPHAEAKLVICLTGSIYDVIVDLRRDSPTYCQWVAVELNARQPRALLYVPEYFAHGFQTLEDNTEVFYQMAQSYNAAAARGLRWNDPALKIQWPDNRPILSERDRNFPDFVPYP
jgi:dTDP-4-dehydrorhamnose 3,5-epimerase